MDAGRRGVTLGRMIYRREFLCAAGAALSVPGLVRAQSVRSLSADLRAAVAQLPQLHSLQVMRGDETVFAEAPRGPGLGALANIKTCSKSVVALLLGAALGAMVARR